jgi:oligoribonuclease
MASNAPKANSHLIWMDLEMTGLDVKKDKILEIACIITNSKLDIVAKGPNLVIHATDEELNTMDEWCIKQHGNTGLTEASRKSTIDVQAAENEVLEFIKQYCPEKACPLAGNSVYMDRFFLMEYMPKLNDYINYRIVDVSTVKELCKRWNSSTFAKVPRKRLTHRALDDIEESIQELKYYQQFMFNQ